ncbi:MAG: HNH endonuclease [Gammaproteobacteria bacterium]
MEQEDVRLAVVTRLAHIAAGGYDRVARKLTNQLRSDVISRSSGLCVLCGKPGDEIDHIEGPSSDIQNLQLLCRSCHTKKTFQRIVPVQPGSKRYKKLKVLHDRFKQSVESKKPLRPCHDEDAWSTTWRQVLTEREFHVLGLNGRGHG